MKQIIQILIAIVIGLSFIFVAYHLTQDTVGTNTADLSEPIDTVYTDLELDFNPTHDTDYSETIDLDSFTIEQIALTDEPLTYGPVEVGLYDQKTSRGTGDPLFATTYFIADKVVHFRITSSTSKTLNGVDVETFQQLSDLIFDEQPKYFYVDDGFMVDRHGVICDDQRMVVDLDTLRYVPLGASTQRYSGYVVDKDFVYVPGSNATLVKWSDDQVPCSVLAGADPETFYVMRAHIETYAKDARVVYLDGSVIAGADPATFSLPVSGSYAYDKDSVFLGTRKVGVLTDMLPSNFTGQVRVLRRGGGASEGYFLFDYEDTTDMLDTITVNSNWNRNYFIADGHRIYVVNKEGQLVAIDMLVGTHQTFNLHLPEGGDLSGHETIGLIDMLLIGDTMYLLKGINCNSHRAPCNLNLYAYQIESGKERLLATNVSEREILGFDTERNQLYLRYADGDAGCFYGRYTAFSFDTLTMNEVGGESGCQANTSYTGSEEDVRHIKAVLPELQGIGLVKSATFVDGEVVAVE